METRSKLRKRALLKALLLVALFFIIAAFILLVMDLSYLPKMLKPQSLADLTPSTMEGAYIEEYIPINYGTYAQYTTTNRNDEEIVLNEYLLVDFDEQTYISLRIGANRVPESDALYDASDQYYSGAITLDQVTPMHVKGTIERMDDELLGYYHKGMEDSISIMHPYHIKDGAIGMHSTFSLLLTLVCFIAAVITGLVFLALGLNGHYLRRFDKKVEQLGDERNTLDAIDRFYDQTAPIGGLRINNQFLLFTTKMKPVLLQPRDVAWIYRHTQTQRVNFIPVAKVHSLVICDMDGNRYPLSMLKKNTDKLLEQVPDYLPGTVLSYSEDLNKLYSDSRKPFENRWAKVSSGDSLDA